ncbi:tail fiber domain-containing protein [Emticicia soli]|uniref:Tail fiber domain-containing protein n=1 Tax=Emticicia soli TaxID=2027878 RepID=A0ABW5JB64_9BACT
MKKLLLVGVSLITLSQISYAQSVTILPESSIFNKNIGDYSNNSTESSAYSLRAIMTNTAPGGFSSALRGINNGTGGLGIGVWGSQAGSGWGIYGVTPDGLGVYGNSSASGTGLYGNSNTGSGIIGTSSNGVAAKFEIYNNTNANTALMVSTVGDGVAAQVTKSGTSGNGSGLIVQKSSPYGGAYSSTAHVDLEVRHPILSTDGMTGLRILNTGPNSNSWTLYTNNSGGALYLFFNGVLKGEFASGNGAYTNFSDARYKNNIQPYASTLDNLMKVGVKSYKLVNSDKTDVGLLAQEVLQYFPEIVYSNTNDKGEQFYTMDYSRIGVLAVKAIQEQQKEIDELRKEIEELKALIKK